MDSLIAVWQGYLQFGVGGSSRWIYLSFDLLLVIILLYFVLKFFNTREGLGYVGLILLLVGSLVLTAYLTLPGAHFLIQLILGVLVVGLPIFYRDKWEDLFRKRIMTNGLSPAVTKGLLNKFTLFFLAIVGAILIVAFGTGYPVKIGDLPSKVTLAAVNLPAGMSANFGGQNSVELIISAPKELWSGLQQESFSAVVDVANQGQGTYSLPVKVTPKSDKVRVIRTKPSQVTVNVEPIISKTVPLAVKFTGSAGNGLVPDDPVFSPDKVTVSGPQSVLATVTQAIIKIALNGETSAIEQKAATPIVANATGEELAGVNVSPAVVDLKVPLVKAGKLKTVGVLPVVTGQVAGGFWITGIVATPAVVTVTGSVDALNSLTNIPTAAVSVAGLNAGTTLKADLNLPSGITVADSVGQISLVINVGATTTTKSITPEIDYANVSANLKVASIDPNSVTTLVSGASADLSGLSNSSVKVSLDLSAYKSAGTYAITITNDDFSLPSGISLVSFLPSAINVTLANK